MRIFVLLCLASVAVAGLVDLADDVGKLGERVTAVEVTLESHSLRLDLATREVLEGVLLGVRLVPRLLLSDLIPHFSLRLFQGTQLDNLCGFPQQVLRLALGVDVGVLRDRPDVADAECALRRAVRLRGVEEVDPEPLLALAAHGGFGSAAFGRRAWFRFCCGEHAAQGGSGCAGG